MNKLPFKRPVRKLKFKRINEENIRKLKFNVDIDGVCNRYLLHSENLCSMIKEGYDYRIIEKGYISCNFETFVKYYCRVPKYKIDNQLCASIIENIYFIMKFLNLEGSTFINNDLLVDTRVAYFEKISKLMKKSKNTKSFVKRDDLIIDNNLPKKPNSFYKDSLIFIDMGDNLYKAMPYKIYKKLLKVEKITTRLTLEHSCIETKEIYTSNHSFTNPVELCRFYTFINEKLKGERYALEMIYEQDCVHYFDDVIIDYIDGTQEIMSNQDFLYNFLEDIM